MRRRATLLSLALSGMFAVLTPQPGHGQTRPSQGGGRQPLVARPSGPPHAWLFGRWTGGIFPVLDTMLEQDCRTQPTIVFGQDTVGHASLLGTALAQRVIETVRTTPTGAEFRFTPDDADADGFGCEDANVLHVLRISDSDISLPRCTAFPYPLKRCPAPAAAH